MRHGASLFPILTGSTARLGFPLERPPDTARAIRRLLHNLAQGA
jgi:hypothetical protein